MEPNYDISDNRAIVGYIRNGDQAAFDTIYRCYFKPLCAFASRFVPTETGENIVQDTMLWLWENRHTLITDMSLKGLLFMIVRNKSLDRIKHNEISGRVHRQIYSKFAATFDDPDFYLETELRTMFEKALADMPDRLRETLTLSRIHKMKHAEIAEHLGISIQTVNYRISQAIKILRRELKDYLPVVLVLFNISGN